MPLNIRTNRKPKLNPNQFKRKPTSTVLKILSGELEDKPHPFKKEAWGYNGNYDYNVYKATLEDKHLMHLKKIKKTNPQILILGPGEGKDIRYLIEDTNARDIFPKINVFGLTKINNHHSAYSYIDKDYSVGIPFEQLDPKIPKHRKIFEENLGKNDLIIALMSTSYHTNSLSFSMYQSAIMLSKGGKAYLQYRYDAASKKASILKKNPKYKNKTDNFLFKEYFEKIFTKFVDNFNKKYNKDYKFKIDWQPLDLFEYGYISIERIN